MKFILDTHLLLWSSSTEEVSGRRRLSRETLNILNASDADLVFSAVSIWEIAIKTAREIAAFVVDPVLFRNRLFSRGFEELPITGVHGASTRHLPPIHKDPFDRLLIAQAMVEGATLLTSDTVVATYPGPIRLV